MLFESVLVLPVFSIAWMVKAVGPEGLLISQLSCLAVAVSLVQIGSPLPRIWKPVIVASRAASKSQVKLARTFSSGWLSER